METRQDLIDEQFGKQVVHELADSLLEELTSLKKRLREKSIHDTRVQSRRLRAAMEAFKDIFPQHPWNALYNQIRQITKNLGRARETEVVLGILKQLTASGDMAENLCREYLEERFKKKLSTEHRRMKKKLALLDRRRLGSQFDFLLSGAGSSGESLHAHSAVDVTKRAKPKAKSRKVAKAHQPNLFESGPEPVLRARRLLDEFAAPIMSFRPRYEFKRATDERLHRLRIEAKKLRYPMEIFDPIWPGSLKEEIALTRALQDAGGIFQDWCVLQESLKVEIRRLKKPETSHLAFQVGRLLALTTDRKAELRKKILPAITDLQNALLKLLGENAPTEESSPSSLRVSEIKS